MTERSIPEVSDAKDRHYLTTVVAFGGNKKKLEGILNPEWRRTEIPWRESYLGTGVTSMWAIIDEEHVELDLYHNRRKGLNIATASFRKAFGEELATLIEAGYTSIRMETREGGYDLFSSR